MSSTENEKKIVPLQSFEMCCLECGEIVGLLDVSDPESIFCSGCKEDGFEDLDDLYRQVKALDAFLEAKNVWEDTTIEEAREGEIIPLQGFDLKCFICENVKLKAPDMADPTELVCPECGDEPDFNEKNESLGDWLRWFSSRELYLKNKK